MAVRIRLRRTGKRNEPCHRIVVTDSRKPRDGRFIEIVGIYDPRRKHERVDVERVDYWLSQGAKPSETVSAIIKRAKAGVPLGHDRADAGAEKAPAAGEETDEGAAVAAAEADAETETEHEDADEDEEQA